MEGEGEGGDCGDDWGENLERMLAAFLAWVNESLTSESYSAIDVVPPATMDAGVADEDEKADAEEELGDAEKVEHTTASHVWEN